MSCYIIELADCALTPYAIETESGTEYGWGLMPKLNKIFVFIIFQLMRFMVI